MQINLFESVFEAIGTPALLLYPDSPVFTIVTANPAYLTATGSSLSDLKGRSLFVAFPDNPAKQGDGVHNLNQSLNEVLATKQSHYLSRQQYDVPKRPSVTLFETRFWDACNTPVFDDQHNIIAILHTVTDVTAQVIAEQKIELNERRFKSLVQEGGDLIGILDATGIYSYVSPTSAAILDLSPEVFIGKCAFDFIHEEDRKKVSDQFGQLKQEHRIQIEPFRFLHGDGSWRWIETTLVNLLDDPSVNGIVANSRDVTGRIKYKQSLQSLNSELIRINQELKASNEDLEQFAFIASHDLQEPLRMISGFMTQLQRKYQAELDEKARKYIHFAVDGASRMRSILMDLLDYSRVGRVNFTKEEVDLNELVAGVRHLLRKQLEEAGAELMIDTLPVLTTCRIPLQQVFMNLISNAVKYTHEANKPLVQISVEKNETEWCFRVCDNGIGIHPDYYSKIFIMFQRLHVKAEVAGTGVGLSITKKIVERLGGKIWLESDPGNGSCFYFTLPSA